MPLMVLENPIEHSVSILLRDHLPLLKCHDIAYLSALTKRKTLITLPDNMV